MALVLGLKVGQSFQVSGNTVAVVSILGLDSFRIGISHNVTGKYRIEEIIAGEFLEILKEVFITAGFGSTNQAKVLIKAPRRIEIYKPVPWKVSLDARKTWEQLFPVVPYNHMFTLANQAVLIGEGKRSYGELTFTVDKTNTIVHIFAKGSHQICNFCFGTRVAFQWDDDEQLLRRVPCSC